MKSSISFMSGTLAAAALLVAVPAQATSAHLVLHETTQGEVTQQFMDYTGFAATPSNDSTVNSNSISFHSGADNSASFIQNATATSFDLKLDSTAFSEWTLLQVAVPVVFTVGPQGGAITVSYSASVQSPKSSHYLEGYEASARFSLLYAAGSPSFPYLVGGPDVYYSSDQPVTESKTLTLNFAATGSVVTYEGNWSLGSTLNGYPLDVTPVPEPETWALMGLGLVAAVAASRKKRRI